MENKNKELQELIKETLTTAESYIEKAIPLVEKLGQDFHKEPSSENWNDLADLFEGIGWIIETLKEIDSIKDLETIIKDHDIWNQYVHSVSKLNPVIPKLEEALEEKDNTAIGHILLKELVPVFQDMKEKLKWLKG